MDPQGRSRRLYGAALLAASLVALGAAAVYRRSAMPAAGPPSPDCGFQRRGFGPRGAVPVQAQTVASDLEVPWGIAFLPDGDWLVTERPGRVRRLREGRLSPSPVATIPQVASAEGGLMGIALHPEFARNRAFFLYASVEKPHGLVNQLQRWVLSSDGASATLERVLVDDIPGARYHDGGRLRMGPDGMLYVATGDATARDRAQDLRSLSGKLLRFTPEGEVPADNPFAGSPVLLLGIRNCEAFDWRDPRTLYVADHGPSGELGRTGHDEVSAARAGENLGWPAIFGCEARTGFVTPSLSWEEAVPPGGAAVYTGEAIPEWRGSLLLGTLRSKHLHRVAFDPSDPRRVASHEVYFLGDPPEGLGRLREVVMGPDRELYVTTSNCDGRGRCPPGKDRILRITSPARPAAGPSP
jgi:glucose/arabinose dehydrogenase